MDRRRARFCQRQERPDCPEVRALVRTGDTPAKERQRMLRRPRCLAPDNASFTHSIAEIAAARGSRPAPHSGRDPMAIK